MEQSCSYGYICFWHRYWEARVFLPLQVARRDIDVGDGRAITLVACAGPTDDVVDAFDDKRAPVTDPLALEVFSPVADDGRCDGTRERRGRVVSETAVAAKEAR